MFTSYLIISNYVTVDFGGNENFCREPFVNLYGLICRKVDAAELEGGLTDRTDAHAARTVCRETTVY